MAIPAILFGAVGTAGQRCTSTRRLIIPRLDLRPSSQKLSKAYQKVTDRRRRWMKAP
jgi:aldehyde dehydrogenase (NAD+)